VTESKNRSEEKGGDEIFFMSGRGPARGAEGETIWRKKELFGKNPCQKRDV